MNKQIKVSVIVPVYNALNYLEDSINSILSQTLKEVEIIFVDDGSSDGSYEMLENYAKKDSRIRVIRQKNAGAGAARNNGLKYAKGEYLSILDADDFYEPDMLEKSYNAALKYNADIVVFDCDYYDDISKQYRSTHSIRKKLLPDNNPFSASEIRKDIFKVFVGWSWDKLFKRSFVEENKLFFQEQRTTNDMLFVFTGVVHAKSIYVMEEILAHHRRGVESLSVTREKSWHCFYDALTALKQELCSTGLYERYKQDYINYCLHFSLWNLDTLKEPTKTLLYNKLREDWFAQMEISKHSKEYFYNKNEYFRYIYICNHSVDDIPSLTEKISLKLSSLTALISRFFDLSADKGFSEAVNLAVIQLKNKQN